MEQAEKLCDMICLIHKGQKVLEGNLTKIKQDWGKNTVTIGYEGSGEYFHALSGVRRYNDFGNSIELELMPETDPSQVLADAARNIRITRFEIKRQAELIAIHDS